MPAEEARRVLITGIGGFTGGHLSTQLELHGYEVHGTVQPHEAQTPRTHHADLLDLPALTAVVEAVRPQYVLHLAAISFVAHDDAEALYRTNIVGTRNL